MTTIDFRSFNPLDLITKLTNLRRDSGDFGVAVEADSDSTLLPGDDEINLNALSPLQLKLLVHDVLNCARSAQTALKEACAALEQQDRTQYAADIVMLWA